MLIFVKKTFYNTLPKNILQVNFKVSFVIFKFKQSNH